MTREEAKRILEFDLDHTYNNESKEALRIAIKALEQEPCDDCINRQVVLDMMQMKMGGKELYKAVYDLPPVTPQPKTGHWIWKTEDIYRCSECYEDIHVKEVMNVPQYEWCPYCGAKMEEERG